MNGPDSDALGSGLVGTHDLAGLEVGAAHVFLRLGEQPIAEVGVEVRVDAAQETGEQQRRREDDEREETLLHVRTSSVLDGWSCVGGSPAADEGGSHPPPRISTPDDCAEFVFCAES